MLKFALCDDNINVLDKITKLLEAIFIKHNLEGIIAIASTKPQELIDYTNKYNDIDVFLLDIDLKSDISGLDLAERFRNTNKKAYMIFTTAHLEYILLAYKFKTFDYLPKPICLEKLEETILRLYADILDDCKSFIIIDNKNTLIRTDSIYFIKKNKMKLIYKTKYEDYENYSSFSKKEGLLPPNFVRCHKSYIVNIENITEIKPNNTIIFDNNPNLTATIGPKYKNYFMEVFNNGFFSNNLDCSNNGK